MEHKICTVIVTYNRLPLLKEAINALRHQSYSSSILVVNNGSTDGTYEYLEEQNDLKILHQENVGGAGGFFSGLKYAAEEGFTFAWIMDDDVLPDKDALRHLVDAYDILSQKETIGFLCSTVVDVEGNMANVPIINERKANNGYSCWNKYLELGYVGVSSATFVSVFIPCNIIYNVGLPYKEFFIWGDDTEYTNRISMKYNSYLIGKSLVKHMRTGGAIDLVKLTDKNRIRMYKFSIRNNWYINKQPFYHRKIKLINYLWYFSLIGKLLLHFQILKIGIVLGGILQGICFRPTVRFPKKNK